MTIKQAIYRKCLECMGEVAKEVTLCHLFECPLWEYRCGRDIKSERYKQRIAKTFELHPHDVAELAKMGITMQSFFNRGSTMAAQTTREMPILQNASRGKMWQEKRNSSGEGCSKGSDKTPSDVNTLWRCRHCGCHNPVGFPLCAYCGEPR